MRLYLNSTNNGPSNRKLVKSLPIAPHQDRIHHSLTVFNQACFECQFWTLYLLAVFGFIQIVQTKFKILIG